MSQDKEFKKHEAKGSVNKQKTSAKRQAVNRERVLRWEGGGVGRGVGKHEKKHYKEN